MPVPVEDRAPAAMVLAVVGIAIPFVCSIAAIVLGIRSRRALARLPGQGGHRLAGIGIWLGTFGLVSWTVIAVLIARR